MKILVIEDEKKIGQFIKKFLEREKFTVTWCESIEEAIYQHHEDKNDVIILDLMLKGESGDIFIKYVKKRHSKVPILILSALSQTDKKIEMLNLGADDYMTKPFEMQELVARVQALYRRFWHDSNTEYKQYGELYFYPKQNKVVLNDKEILFTIKEAEILFYLLEKKGHVVTPQEFIANVWKRKSGFNSNIIAVTIRRLRKKLATLGHGEMIESVHGIGYRITPLS